MKVGEVVRMPPGPAGLASSREEAQSRLPEESETRSSRLPEHPALGLLASGAVRSVRSSPSAVLCLAACAL